MVTLWTLQPKESFLNSEDKLWLFLGTQRCPNSHHIISYSNDTMAPSGSHGPLDLPLCCSVEKFYELLNQSIYKQTCSTTRQ